MNRRSNVFTDYRSQGQTIPKVIIDIEEPTTGSPLTLFNVYVALSRSHGRDGIRLLRSFNENLFKRKLPSSLFEEDHRLEMLNETMKKWWDKLKTLNISSRSDQTVRETTFVTRKNLILQSVQNLRQMSQNPQTR